MKKTKKILTTTSLFIFLGLFFILTNNAEAIKYEAEVGFGAFKTGVPMEIDGNSIGTYINEVYKYSVGVVGILATIVIMWGGVRWLTAGGDKGAVDDAKKWIEGAVSGLVLILSSYFILNFVNPDLVNFKSIEIEKIKSTPSGASGSWDDGSGQIDTNVATALDGQFTINKCKGSETEGCASVYNLRPETIGVALDAKRESGIATNKFIITSGHEGAPSDGIHKDTDFSHYNFWKFDVEDTAEVVGYIENPNFFTPMGKRHGDNAEMYQNKANGSCWAREGTHVDVTPKNCQV